MSPQEFKERFMPYHRMLYRVAFGFTGNVQDAEDLLQDTFMRMWQKRDLLTHETTSEAYLIIMMKNIHLDKVRQKAPDTSAPVGTVVDVSFTNMVEDGWVSID